MDATAACVALIRQLANSDANKAEIMAAGGGRLLLSLLECHSSPGGWEVVEHVLGTLCALTLRSPETSEALLELGAVDAVMEVLQAGFDLSKQGSRKVLRLRGCCDGSWLMNEHVDVVGILHPNTLYLPLHRTSPRQQQWFAWPA